MRRSNWVSKLTSLVNLTGVIRRHRDCQQAKPPRLSVRLKTVINKRAVSRRSQAGCSMSYISPIRRQLSEIRWGRNMAT